MVNDIKKIIENISDFKSTVLPKWVEELYTEPDIRPTKEEIDSICFDAYLRGIKDVLEFQNQYKVNK